MNRQRRLLRDCVVISILVGLSFSAGWWAHSFDFANSRRLDFDFSKPYMVPRGYAPIWMTPAPETAGFVAGDRVDIFVGDGDGDTERPLMVDAIVTHQTKARFGMLLPHGVDLLAYARDNGLVLSYRHTVAPPSPILKSEIQYKNAPDAARFIPERKRVVTVRFAEDDTMAGLLRNGDRVDVFGVMKPRTYSRTFLRVQVYSVRKNHQAKIIVGLLVTEAQAEAIAFFQKYGSIKLFLRADGGEIDENERVDIEDFKKLLRSQLEDKEEVTQLLQEGTQLLGTVPVLPEARDRQGKPRREK